MTDLREAIAKAIWEKRPDCAGKPWPLPDDYSKRAYKHNPIAAVDLCFIYADAAIAVIETNDQLRALNAEMREAIAAYLDWAHPTQCDDTQLRPIRERMRAIVERTETP